MKCDPQTQTRIAPALLRQRTNTQAPAAQGMDRAASPQDSMEAAPQQRPISRTSRAKFNILRGAAAMAVLTTPVAGRQLLEKSPPPAPDLAHFVTSKGLYGTVSGRTTEVGIFCCLETVVISAQDVLSGVFQKLYPNSTPYTLVPAIPANVTMTTFCTDQPLALIGANVTSGASIEGALFTNELKKQTGC